MKGKKLKKLWKYVKGLKSDLNWLMDTVAEMECHEHPSTVAHLSEVCRSMERAAAPSLLKDLSMKKPMPTGKDNIIKFRRHSFFEEGKSMVEEVRGMADALDGTKKVYPMGKYGPIVEDERIAADPLVQEAAIKAMALGNLVEELCEECSEDPLAFTKRIEALREREEAEGYDQLTAALAEVDDKSARADSQGNVSFHPCQCDLCKRMREIEAGKDPDYRISDPQVAFTEIDEAAEANDQLERALAEIKEEIGEAYDNAPYLADIDEIWLSPEHKI